MSHQQEVYKANLSLFVQGFVGRYWDDLQKQPADVAMVIFSELSVAAAEAAQKEHDNYGIVGGANAEALMGQGENWMPTIEFL